MTMQEEIKPPSWRFLSADDLARCAQISPRRSTPMPEIVREVSAATGISTAEIYGRSRIGKIAQARQIVMYLCREKGMTLTQIGNLLHRDHTTVMAGIEAEKRRRGLI